ncbi:MAG: hypothetical protein P9L99_21020 [Candidatus Lernaella stagnicola]|nr:hypothetical protein [Candidatus Lernaella stagnicola]
MSELMGRLQALKSAEAKFLAYIPGFEKRLVVKVLAAAGDLVKLHASGEDNGEDTDMDIYLHYTQVIVVNEA